MVESAWAYVPENAAQMVFRTQCRGGHMSENRSDSNQISELEDLIRQCQTVEASLRESREIYKTVLQQSFAAIYIVQNGKFCAVNFKVADYSGYPIEELIGMKTDSVVHPDDKSDVLRRARAMLRGDTSTPYVYRIITKERDIRWIIETVSMITYEGRSAILGNCMDITEHRQAIQKLQDSENLYRAIFETTLAATIIIEEDTTVSLVNSEFTKLSGYSREEWEGKKSWTEFVVPEDRERMKTYHQLRRISRETVPRSYEFGLVNRWGEVRNVILMVDMIPHTNKSVASFIDITEHKRSAVRLKESEDLYRTIFETTGTATIIIEADTTVSLVNSEFIALSGYSREEWEGKKSWTEFVIPEDREMMKKYHYARRVDPCSVPRKYEFRFIDSRDRLRDVILMVDMIPGTGKSVASFADITEHKLAATKIKESEDLYRTTFENTGTATIIISEDLTISLANTEFKVLTGASKETWEGNRLWTNLFKPKDLKNISDFHQKREIHTDQRSLRNFQCTIKDRRGNRKTVLISSAPIPDSGKSVLSLTDITEQKKTEAALRAREEEIHGKSKNLEEMNTALKVILKQREDDRRELEEKVLSNVDELIIPRLTELRTGRLSQHDIALLDIVESNIVKIVSPFSQRLSTRHLNLTHREMQVANFIREGKSSKEIAELLSICTGAVSFHRDNLRKKLGLNNKRINLKAHLDSLS